jgi:hypothetical protein
MKNTTNGIGFMSELEQSKVFGDQYEEILKTDGSPPALGYFVKDVEELLNNILLKCNNISNFQILVLHGFFIAFNHIRRTIDPIRLESFESTFNGDDELVLFRNTDKGIINIIINPDECFAFSFIPKNPDDQKSLTFYDEDYQDFEGLAYRFFS